MIAISQIRPCWRYLMLVLNCSAMIVCATGILMGQTNDCDKPRTGTAKYKVVRNEIPRFAPNTRSLRIVVKEKLFNRDSMVRLARTIRRQFCSDDEISVMIFDDERVARNMDEGLYLAGKIKVPELRGLYAFGDHGRSDSIEFSTKRGNPISEIVIDLTSQ